MTKLKSKKMSKSTFAIIIMAIAMVAMLAFGGTYAYFTSETFSRTGDATTQLGKISLQAEGDVFTAEMVQNVLPSESLFESGSSNITITDSSNRESYIFVQYSVVISKDGQESKTLSGALAKVEVKLDGSKVAELEEAVTGVYAFKTDKANAEDADNEAYTIVLGADSLIIPADLGNAYQEATVTLTVSVCSVQGTFGTATEAWNSTFGA
jgi:predicted ribosomally synthesized peptide with SipW-like signal peptide